MSNLFKKKDWEDSEGNKYTIRVREDGYVCATDMAKATGKRLQKFLEYSETQEYLQVLSKRCNIPINKDDKNTFTRYNKSTGDSINYIIETSKGRIGVTQTNRLRCFK